MKKRSKIVKKVTGILLSIILVFQTIATPLTTVFAERQSSSNLQKEDYSIIEEDTTTITDAESELVRKEESTKSLEQDSETTDTSKLPIQNSPENSQPLPTVPLNQDAAKLKSYSGVNGILIDDSNKNMTFDEFAAAYGLEFADLPDENGNPTGKKILIDPKEQPEVSDVNAKGRSAHTGTTDNGRFGKDIYKNYGDIQLHTRYILIDGVPGICLDPGKDNPTGENYDQGVLDNLDLYNVLYFGYNANVPGRNTVDMYWNTLVAGRLVYYENYDVYGNSPGDGIGNGWKAPFYDNQSCTYSSNAWGNAGMYNDLGVADLIQHARNKDAPFPLFKIDNGDKTANWNASTYTQETDWYRPTSTPGVTYTVNLPPGDEVEIMVEGDNVPKKSSVSIPWDKAFKLRAGPGFDGTLNINITTDLHPITSIIFNPNPPTWDSPDGRKIGLQRVVSYTTSDSTISTSIIGRFSKRYGDLEVRKFGTDSNTAAFPALPGMHFEVQDLNGNVVKTGITDSNGYAKITGLLFGVYSIKETVSPTGYTYSVPQTQQVMINPKSTSSVEFRNNRVTGEIKIHKSGEKINGTGTPEPSDYGDVLTFTYTQQNLANTKFKVVAAEDITTIDGRTIMRAGETVVNASTDVNGLITTDTEGNAKITDLYLGKYNVIEVEAPVGFVLADNQAERTKQVTLQQPPNDYTTSNVIGRAEFANERQENEFVLYKAEEKVVSYVNGKLVSEIISGDGFIFGIYAKNDIKNTSGTIITPKDSLLSIVETQEDGIGKSKTDIPECEVYVKELKSKPQLVLNDTIFNSRYRAVGNAKLVQTAVNDGTAIDNTLVRGSLEVTKLDGETRKPIEGVEFKVYNEDKSTVAYTGRTNAQGIFTINDVPYGRYFYRETVQGNGYITDGLFHEFTLQYDKQVCEFTQLNYPAKGTASIIKTGEMLTSADTTSTPYGNGLSFKYSQQPLQGVEYKLIALEDIVIADKIVRYHAGEDVISKDKTGANLVTGNDGKASAPGLVTGKYAFVEVSVPNGYILDSTPIPVTITYNNASATVDSPVVRAQNGRERASILAEKQKETKISYNGSITKKIEPAQGVVFGVYTTHDVYNYAGAQLATGGQLISTIETNGSGIASTNEDLPPGDYYLVELKAPVGCRINSTPFHVVFDKTQGASNNPVKKLYINNGQPLLNTLIQKNIEFEKVAADTNSHIPGTTIGLFDNATGNLLAESVTGANGIAYFRDVPWGIYYYQETKAAIGYEIDKTQYPLTVSDETGIKNKMVNKLKNFRIVATKYAPQLNSVTQSSTAYGDLHNFRYTDAPLPGTTLQLTAGEDITTSDGVARFKKGDIVAEGVTGNDGKFAFENIYPGTYIIKETKSPAGYQLNPNAVTVRLADDGSANNTITANTQLNNQRQQVEFEFNKTQEVIDHYENNAPVIVQTPLQNAIFGLYTREPIVAPNGTTLLDKNKMISLITTGVDGKGTSKLDLPVGFYYLKELSTASNLQISPTLFNTEYSPSDGISPNDPVRKINITNGVPIVNQLITGSLKVIKYSEGGEIARKPLAGATIKLYTTKDELVTEGVTDINGAVLFNDLKYGSYYFIETQAPNGCLLNPAKIPFDIKTQGTIVEKSIDNSFPRGVINIHKTGEKIGIAKANRDPEFGDVYSFEYTQQNLENSTFNVYARNDIITPEGTLHYHQNDLVGTITSDGNGNGSLGNLYVGDYYLKEASAPHGFVIDPNEYNISIGYQGQNQPVINSNSEQTNKRQKVSIELLKHEQHVLVIKEGQIVEETIPSDGIVFGLYTRNALKDTQGNIILDANKLVSVMVTGSDGVAKSKDDLPKGDYYAKELKTKAHLIIDKNEYDITYNPADNDAQTIRSINNGLPIVNKLINGSIKVVKKDSESGKPLEGVVIKLLDKDKKEIAKGTTDKDGVVEFKQLPFATYYYQEESTIYGYIPDTTEHQVDIFKADQRVEEDLLNTPIKGRLEITKTGETLESVNSQNTEYGDEYSFVYGQLGLQNAEFTIHADEDIIGKDGTLHHRKNDKIATIKTDERGFANLDDLYLGKYSLKETVAPIGYQIDTTTHQFEIAYTGVQIDPVIISPMALQNNRQQVELNLNKEAQEVVDFTDGVANVENKKIEGIVFGLYNAEDIYTPGTSNILLKRDSLVSIMTTDGNGNAKADTDLPSGKYYAKELKTHDPYQLNVERYEAIYKPESNNEIYRIDLNNRKPIPNDLKTGTVKVRKLDAETNKGVPNAEINILNKDKTIIYSGKTDAQGYMELKNLPYGDYFYQENKAPEGYTLNQTISPFEIREHNKTVEVSVANTPVKGKITVEKTGEMLESAATIESDYGPIYHFTYTHQRLSGVKFDVVAAADIITGDGTIRAHKGDVVAQIETTDDGTIATSDLYLGKYTLKETYAPDGYQINPDTYETELVYAGQMVPNVSVTVTAADDRQKVDFNLQKECEVLTSITDGKVTIITKPVEGIVFGLYNRNAIMNTKGVTIVEKDSLLDVVTTDENGQALSKEDLPAGEIYAKEIKTLSNLVLNETEYPATYIPTGNEALVHKFFNDNNAIPNALIRGNITVIKQDITTSLPVAGAEITFYDGSDKVIYVAITDAEGKVNLNDLPYGQYSYAETKAPKGYIINTEKVPFEINANGQKIEKIVQNKPVMGTIDLEKLGEQLNSTHTTNHEMGETTHFDYTMQPMRGAEYDVIAAEKIITQDGSVRAEKGDIVDHIVSGENGKAISKPLHLGNYELLEIKAPDGYQLDTKKYPVSLTYADQNTELVVTPITLQDSRQKTDVNFIKTEEIIDGFDPNTGHSQSQQNSSEGIVFGLYTAEDIHNTKNEVVAPKDTLIDVITTDKDGKGVSKDDIPANASVYIKELKTKTHLNLNTNKYGATYVPIGNDAKVHTNINALVPIENNFIRGKVQIQKIDTETKQPILNQGAVIQIRDDKNNIVYTGTTNNYGIIELENLPFGKYHYQEITAPSGYILNPAVYDFEIKTLNEIVKVDIEDKPAYGQITVKKTGEKLNIATTEETEYGSLYHFDYRDLPLDGATFNVIAKETIKTPDGTIRAVAGDIVDTIHSNNEGIAVTKQLYLGNYMVQETIAPNGFLLSSNTYDASLIYQDQNIEVVSTSVGINNDRQKVDFQLKKQGELVTAIEDGKIVIKKKPLAGVVFGLFTDKEITDSTGKTIVPANALMSLMTTDAAGYATSKDDLPTGDYYAKEVKTLDGYVLNETHYTASYKPQGNDPIIHIMLNNNEWIDNSLVKSDFELTKADITTEKSISGMEVRIYDSNKYVIYQGITDKSGKVKIEKLPYGSYFYQEITAPEGYQVDSKIYPFQIDKNGEIVKSTIKNATAMGKIKINKTGQKLHIANIEQTEYGDKYNFVYSDQSLENAVFDLIAKDDIKTADGTLRAKAGSKVATLKTEMTGQVTSEDLYLGTYILKEVNTPDGFQTAPDQEVTIAYAGQTVPVVTATTNISNARQEIEFKIKKAEEKLIGFENGEAKTEMVSSSGVVFGLYTRSVVTNANGDIIAPKDVLIDIATTDKDGIATFHKENSPAIAVYAKELKTKPYLVLDSTLYGGESKPIGNEPIIESWLNNGKAVENKLNRGNAQITKIDTTTGNTIPNAKVKLYDSNKVLIIEAIADDKGMVTLNNLPYGTYFYQESEAPNGYLINHDLYSFEIKNNGQIIQAKMEDRPVMGTLNLHKTGEMLEKAVQRTTTYGVETNFHYTQQGMEGAIFEIVAKEDIVTGDRTIRHKAGDIVQTITTGSDGNACAENLFLGKYTIKEIFAPDGFQLAENQDFELTYMDQNTEIVQSNVGIKNNRQSVVFNLLKHKENPIVNAIDQNIATIPAKGIVFALYAAEDIRNAKGNIICTRDSVVSYMVTDNNGIGRSKADLPAGHYYAKEIKTDSNLILDNTYFEVSYTPMGNEPKIEIAINNGQAIVNKTVPGKFELLKRDSITGQPLANAGFKIFDSEKNVIHEATTDLSGKITIEGLNFGTYYYAEYQAPSGYRLDNSMHQFIVKNDGIVTVEAANAPAKGIIEINKKGEMLDSATNHKTDEGIEYNFVYEEKGLSNAKFEIAADQDILKADGSFYAYKGDVVDTVTTDIDGYAHTKELEFGAYTVREVSTPIGYIKMENRRVILEQKKTDPITKEKIDVVNKRQKANIALYKEEESLFSFSNNTITTVYKPAEGIVFGLYTAEDIKNSEHKTIVKKNSLISVMTTGSDGYAYSKDTLPQGKYYAKELKTKSHLVLSKATYGIDYIANNNDEDLTLTIKEGEPIDNNLKKGYLELSKVDSSNGKLLPNAGIRLYSANKEVIFEGKTNSNGKLLLGDLPQGVYYYQETKAPKGYSLDETLYPIEIKENKQICKENLENQPDGSVSKESGKGGSANPGTGTYISDSSYIVLGVIVFVLAIAFFAAVYYTRKKAQR